MKRKHKNSVCSTFVREHIIKAMLVFTMSSRKHNKTNGSSSWLNENIIKQLVFQHFNHFASTLSEHCCTSTLHKHFIQALYQTTSSKHFIKALHQITLSKHLIQAFYPSTLSKHLIKALYPNTLSRYF